MEKTLFHPYLILLLFVSIVLLCCSLEHLGAQLFVLSERTLLDGANLKIAQQIQNSSASTV
jgi:hypothetical protein